MLYLSHLIRATYTTNASFGKWRGNVTKNKCVVVLPSLVRYHPGIDSGRRSEVVPSRVGDSSRESKEESLNRNDVNGVNQAVSVHIRSRQPAAGKRRSDNEEVSLDRHYVDRINSS